jgi:hypothetical protein
MIDDIFSLEMSCLATALTSPWSHGVPLGKALGNAGIRETSRVGIAVRQPRRQQVGGRWRCHGRRESTVVFVASHSALHFLSRSAPIAYQPPTYPTNRTSGPPAGARSGGTSRGRESWRSTRSRCCSDGGCRTSESGSADSGSRRNTSRPVASGIARPC